MPVRRRIALVTSNYDTVADGVSRTLTRLVRYLQQHGYGILIVGPRRAASRTAQALPYLAVPSIPIPGRSEYQLPLGLSRSAQRMLVSFSPDLVHIATPDILGLQALNWATARGIPVASSYHTHFPSYLAFYHAGAFRPVMEWYLAWFYRRCRHVYVPTPNVEAYARRLGLDGQVRLWGRGVDCRHFSPAWRSETWRRRHGFEPGVVVVTFVGRLVKEKGLDVVAAVLEKLETRAARIRGMIVGDGPLRQELEARLPNARFTGHLEGEELARAYASSDVFLFPSETEAFGNVIVEAMASELPVIASASSGSSCHVDPGKNGLLADPGDVEAFAGQTMRLALDPAERRRLGMNGRLKAKAYDWDRALACIVRYYDELIA